MSSALCAQFLQTLEKNGFFAHCTSQQRTLKQKQAEEYFAQHYSPNASFVSLPNNSPATDKTQAALELKTQANTLVEQRHFTEAISLYTQAIQLAPSAVLYSNRASAYIAINENTLAVEDCKKALELDCNFAKAYGRLGVAYTNLDQFKEAKTAFEDALRIDPNNTIYRNNLDQVTRQLERQQHQPSPQQPSRTTSSQTPPHPSSSSTQPPPRQDHQDQSQSNVFQSIISSFQSSPLFAQFNQANGQNNDIMNFARTILTNPAMSSFLDMIASMLGLPADEVRQSLASELEPSESDSSRSSSHTPPPGFI